MPEDEYVWLPRASLLTFEELTRLVGVFARLGVAKVRLTGGEPLLRHDLATLTGMLGRVPGVTDVALTTNGLLLARQAAALRAAGLRRVTVSLDTLRPERMREFARSSGHADVLAGLAAAQQAGFAPLKLNTVVVRGFNDDEVEHLVEFARERGAEPRFIEYMDVGGATRWSAEQVVSRDELLRRLAARYGAVTPRRPRRSAARATADASRRTARSSCVSTPSAAWTCGSPCGRGRRTTTWRVS
jgi:cyclic pyranopterin phosphate synthase